MKKIKKQKASTKAQSMGATAAGHGFFIKDEPAINDRDKINEVVRKTYDQISIVICSLLYNGDPTSVLAFVHGVSEICKLGIKGTQAYVESDGKFELAIAAMKQQKP